MKTKKSSAKKAKFEDEKSAKQVEDAAAKAVIIDTTPETTTPSTSPIAEKELTISEKSPKPQQEEVKRVEQLPERELPTAEVKENIPSVSEPVAETSPVPLEVSSPTSLNSNQSSAIERERPVTDEKRKKRKKFEEDVKRDPIEPPKEIEQPIPAPAPAPITTQSLQSNYVADGPEQQLEQVFKPAEEKEPEEEQKPLSDDEWENGIPSEKPKLPEVEEIKIEPTKQKRRGKKRKKQSKDQAEEGPRADKKAKGKKKNDEDKAAFSDTLVKVALRYTRAPTRYLAKKMPGLRDNLLRSNLRISPEGLIAISLLFTFIAIPISIVGAYVLATFGFTLEAYAVPAVSILPFFMGISVPKISASSRASALDNELPYLFAYITVLAGGGISPMVTLKRITKAANIFPASAKEAKRIVMDIEIFGLDAISALEREARLTPNKVFSDFIGGYVAVLKTGGDALSFLEAKLKDIFAYRESKIRGSSEFIATMSEAYIITTVVMGVSLMILWATQNLMSPNGMPSSTQQVNSSMIIMFSGFAVPFISLIFIVVIGSSQVREPYSYDLPFYIFLGCIPVGALIYFLPLGLTPYFQLGIGLTAITTPPMVIQMIYRKRKASVEAKLASFLRDISEIRKTGLAPEKTIEQLSNRNYGGLTIYVKKIAAQVSWGTPLRTVLQNFTKEVKSWVGRAVAFLLLEVVDVGGGSAKMFISLADFTEKNDQLDKAKKSQIRPYIIIPYIGAILVVATTAMMVYYTGFSFTAVQGVPANFQPNPAVLKAATTTLLMAAFFQAWVMGFVAGKMGEGSAADGFKHATFLIVISMVTVIVSGFFIKL
jgi:flagellar protein FlaJ